MDLDSFLRAQLYQESQLLLKKHQMGQKLILKWEFTLSTASFPMEVTDIVVIATLLYAGTTRPLEETINNILISVCYEATASTLAFLK